jgi:formylglycine-generating enzyme required for sulfatase activity
MMTMLRKKIKKPEPHDEDRVHLPCLFGIKPGKYLAVLYGLIILLVLFFSLCYPGLSNPGTELLVQSRPWGAAIRIDDIYFGTSPCRIFVPEGKHKITALMPGFIPVERDIEVGGRILGSLFFPKTTEMEFPLKEQSPLASLIERAQDYAAWTFTGEPTESYQIPLALSEGMYRSAPEKSENADTEALLKAAARFMVTRAALKDLLRAEFLAKNKGNAASPFSVLDAARFMLNYVQENPAFALALGDLLPDEEAEKLISSSFYPEVWKDSVSSSPARTIPVSRASSPLTIEGVVFSLEFLANSYVQNTAFQHTESVGNFMISQDEISFSLWDAFLRENPAWGIDNLADLLEKKQVTEEYLQPRIAYTSMRDFLVDYPEYPTPAVSGVSFFAAQAFCLWLNSKLPVALARDYEVRLPTEAEWEYAAKYGEAYFGAVHAGGPRRMSAFYAGANNDPGARGLWEWCSDYFAPLNYLSAPQDAIKKISSPERSVRGGSWVNPVGTVIADTRASLPPEMCSPFVGFRVVLAAKEG